MLISRITGRVVRPDDDRTRRYPGLLLILSAAVNVIAGVVFISMLGLTDAAIATTIALIVRNVAMAFFISRHSDRCLAYSECLGRHSRDP